MSDKGHLIVTRRAGERIFVGNDITFEVMDVKGNHVRCKVTAPKSVPVHREEVALRIAAERELLTEAEGVR